MSQRQAFLDVFLVFFDKGLYSHALSTKLPKTHYNVNQRWVIQSSVGDIELSYLRTYKYTSLNTHFRYLCYWNVSVFRELITSVFL